MTRKLFDREVTTLFSRATNGSPCYWKIEKDQLADFGMIGSDGFLAVDSSLNRARSIAVEFSTEKLSALLYFDLGFSSEIGSFAEKLMTHVLAGKCDVYLYAVEADVPLFDIEGECYFLEVDLRPRIQSNSLYRSFRDKESVRNRWEFSNGLYVWDSSDRQGPY